MQPIADYYWQAFQTLSSARQIGMGQGPIPFPAIVQFARVYGISDMDEFEALREIVAALDSEYLKINQPNDESVSSDDGEKVGSVMQSLKARAAAAFGEVDE